MPKLKTNLLNGFKSSRKTGACSDAKLLSKRRDSFQDPSPIHIALIKLKLPSEADDDLAKGISSTLSQLHRLGLSNVIVLDREEYETFYPDVKGIRLWRRKLNSEADRLVSFLQGQKSTNACRLDDVLGALPHQVNISSTTPIKGAVEVQYRQRLLAILRSGSIPVILPIAYTTESQKIVYVDADDVILAFTRAFAGINIMKDSSDSRTSNTDWNNSQGSSVNDMIALDRIILLDPLGGFPSDDRAENAHIFVNMEQEYDNIRSQLDSLYPQCSESTEKSSGALPVLDKVSIIRTRHLKNLKLLKNALALLPPSSSALLTTPYEAAITSTSQKTLTEGLGVGTRGPKNLLIHNLLTDRPLISSSLPTARMVLPDRSSKSPNSSTNNATFVKRGMPVTIVPDSRQQAWEPPKVDTEHLTLKDPRIDLPRLLELIEDSFNRPINISHYLNRIQNKIAGVIVAGEYEGGAILTWELPPGVVDDGSEEIRQRMVPYLDKFAVLKRSQGAGGVADIVFTAMVRSCFPHGVCWRSRKNNPVNKWYFERAAGTWKLPDTNWTMFWTTEDLIQGSQKWSDYEQVCRSVLPSWADTEHAAD